MTNKEAAPQIDEVLPRRAVIKALGGVHRTTLNEWVRRGELPPPVRLSERITGWRRSTIEAFIAKREQGSAKC